MAQTPASTPATSPATMQTPPGNSGGVLAVDLAGDLLQSAPKPSPGFAAAVLGEKTAPAGEAPTTPATAAGHKIKTADYLRDSDGNIFDRRYCVTGRNGAPRKTPSGLWEMRKDPATGNRFKRAVKLNKSLRGKPSANTIRVETRTPGAPGIDGGQTWIGPPLDDPAPIERPRLVLPGSPEFKETPAAENAADDINDIPAGPSLDAIALAAVLDAFYWAGLAPMIAVPQAVEAVKKSQGAGALAALTAGLDQCQDLPRLPWWVPVLTIYTMAGASMFNHSQNQQKALTVKEKIARWWLNLKHRKGAQNG